MSCTTLPRPPAGCTSADPAPTLRARELAGLFTPAELQQSALDHLVALHLQLGVASRQARLDAMDGPGAGFALALDRLQAAARDAAAIAAAVDALQRVEPAPGACSWAEIEQLIADREVQS